MKLLRRLHITAARLNILFAMILTEIKFAADVASFISSCVPGTFICLAGFRESGINCPLIGEHCVSTTTSPTIPLQKYKERGKIRRRKKPILEFY